MDHWDEIRTAFQVAKHGTVSGAAAELGVHHATVIRHIDALEARMGGVKLFQRHARGYTPPTEAGADLARVGQATEDQFCQLGARLQGQGETISGELVITTLAGFSGLIVPAVAAFQQAHPGGLRVRFLTGQRLFRLEYGEAHVAIRAGGAPPHRSPIMSPSAFIAWKPRSMPPPPAMSNAAACRPKTRWTSMTSSAWTRGGPVAHRSCVGSKPMYPPQNG